MQGHAEEHLLRAFQRRAVEGADDIALDKKVEASIVKQLVALGLDVCLGEVDVLARVVLEDIGAVQAPFSQCADFLIKTVDAACRHRLRKLAAVRKG